MQLLKKIFGFIWALWGGFWFMLVALVFTPIYAVVFAIWGKKYTLHCVWINCHYLSPFLLAMNLIRVRVHHRELIDKSRTYVFVGNHLTAIDILATATAMPIPMRFLAKIETRNIPVFGYMVKMLGIRVDRKSKESREKSYQLMADALQRGESLYIYPEGTRNRTTEPLKEFKDGAFKVAIMAQVPVAVQTLVGVKNVNNPEGFQLYPGVADVYWSQPIETAGMTMDDLPRLKEMVRQQMLQHLPHV